MKNYLLPYESKKFSQHGEDGIIDILIKHIAEKDYTFLEIGFGNGKVTNMSKNLFLIKKINNSLKNYDQIRIIDLGTGTGSNFRFLSKKIRGFFINDRKPFLSILIFLTLLTKIGSHKNDS